MEGQPLVSVFNITRDEARTRAALLNVAEYDVDLDLTSAVTESQTFRSVTVVRFTCHEPGASTYIDITAPAVHAARLNGQELDVASGFDGNRLQLPDLAASNELVVEADCRYMRTGEGLHRFVDPVDQAVYLYTQFETFDAHRMFACFDQPDLKAAFTFRVLAPASWVVVSNTVAEVTATDGGAKDWRFATTPRMSTYITAIVAGPYYSVHDEHDGIPMGIYCRESLAEFVNAEDIFTVTKQGFDHYHRAFDYRYPFGKYDQLFVPEFNAGAMENAACVTFLEDYLFRSKETEAAYERRAETILHELAHMWYGDLVTMRWFDDLWLNESFASYVSVVAMVEATRYQQGWTTFANVEKTWAYRQDQLPTTHPIVSDIHDNDAVRVNFDGITYAKGAAVLKQLVHWVGREAFLTGMRTYFRRHEYGNTTLADLLSALEEASGRDDLATWSKEWLETAGVNTLRARFETSSDGLFTAFSVAQEAPEQHPQLRSHRIAIGLYDRTSEGLLRRDRVEVDIVGALTEVPTLVGRPQPDLLLVNDDDLTYAKIRLDPHSLRTVTDHIYELRDSLPRALCWAAAWDMTRDAEMSTRDYVTLVVGGAAHESDVGVVQTLLRQAGAAVEQFATPAHRPAYALELADEAARQVRAAAPGSDHQLAWARALANGAETEEQRALVRRWLDGTEELPGLAVDTELRWQLLTALATHGLADEADIEAELRRDPTATGQRRAVTARAARPTEAAKAEVWRHVVEVDELPNAEQSAAIAGFLRWSQRDLLRPYRERYFADIATVWAERTPEMARNIAVGLYPAYVDDEETIAMTDDYIRRADPPPPLRRLLVEGRDGIARALRAQAKDAATSP